MKCAAKKENEVFSLRSREIKRTLSIWKEMRGVNVRRFQRQGKRTSFIKDSTYWEMESAVAMKDAFKNET